MQSFSFVSVENIAISHVSEKQQLKQWIDKAEFDTQNRVIP